MKLVSFSIQNYRSITTTHKLKIKDSTILIGPNNEGKSNILKALVVVLGLISRLGKSGIYRGKITRSPRFRRISSDYDYESVNSHFDCLFQALDLKECFFIIKGFSLFSGLAGICRNLLQTITKSLQFAKLTFVVKKFHRIIV